MWWSWHQPLLECWEAAACEICILKTSNCVPQSVLLSHSGAAQLFFSEVRPWRWAEGMWKEMPVSQGGASKSSKCVFSLCSSVPGNNLASWSFKGLLSSDHSQWYSQRRTISGPVQTFWIILCFLNNNHLKIWNRLAKDDVGSSSPVGRFGFLNSYVKSCFSKLNACAVLLDEWELNSLCADPSKPGGFVTQPSLP